MNIVCVSDAKQLGDLVLLQVRADDAQLAGDIGAAGADLVLAGNHVEFVPGVAAVYDALGAQNLSVLCKIGKRTEGPSDLFFGPSPCPSW